MNTFNLRWLRLELKNEESLSARYTIIHTHFAMYAYLLEQGYVLSIYMARNYEKDQPHGVMYIQTNHPGYFEACQANYAHDFDVVELSPYFSLPTNYSLILGINQGLKNPYSA